VSKVTDFSFRTLVVLNICAKFDFWMLAASGMNLSVGSGAERKECLWS
jgi:hypothetical protein